MEIQTDPSRWDSDDVASLRGFLASVTGRRLLSRLFEFIPELLEGGGTNEVLIRSGKVKGYNEAIKNLLGSTEMQPEVSKSSDMYPPLENDEAHNDGQKFKE